MILILIINRHVRVNNLFWLQLKLIGIRVWMSDLFVSNS